MEIRIAAAEDADGLFNLNAKANGSNFAISETDE